MLNKIDREVKFIDNLYLKTLKEKQILTLIYVLHQKMIKKNNIYFNIKIVEEKLINNNYKILIDIIYKNYFVNDIEIYSNRNKYKIFFEYKKIKNKFEKINSLQILNMIQLIIKRDI